MNISPIGVRLDVNKACYNKNPQISMKGKSFNVKTDLCNKSNKLVDWLKNYFGNYSKRINYTWQHKKAFLKVEKELCGKNSWKGYFHDADKLLMYIVGVPKQTAHNIHVSTVPHHVRNGKIKYPDMAVIDWESARYTKPDKPLSAREYYESYFVQKQNIRIPEIEEVFEKFGL